MVYLIVLGAVLARFAIYHPANFSPVYAALLFSGAFLKKRDSIWFPLVILAIGDVLLTTVVYGAHFTWFDIINWLGFGAIALIGWWLRGHTSVGRVLAASLVGPAVFFLISNFGVWLSGLMYPPTPTGLAACYTAAIPFLGNSLASGVLFSAILFGGYEYYRRRVAQPRNATPALG
jgi:Family of unknown function (DUF6580)